jgi:hypothetical protein
VLADMIRRDTAPGVREALHGPRDANSLRAFLTGHGILFLLDSPSLRRAPRRQVRVQ